MVMGCTAGLLIAALDDRVVGVEKEDVITFTGVQRFESACSSCSHAAHAAHVHHDSHAVQLVFALQGKVHDTGQQCHRDVIDAEKTNIFQRVDGH